MFVCTQGEIVGMAMLCDGNRDCSNGDDETTSLCESKTFYNSYCIDNSHILSHTDKCRLPYYGGCPKTRECITSEFDVNCGFCLLGYMEDPDMPERDCLGLCSLHHIIYSADGLVLMCVCDIDIDECEVGDPCETGAMCINNNGSFICVCREGFTEIEGRCIGEFIPHQ